MRTGPRAFSCGAFLLTVALFGMAPGPPLAAHGSEARYLQPVPWTKPHFARIVGLGYSALGMDLDRIRFGMELVDGRSCATGNIIAFDVDDSYAFDIDEPIDLTLTYAAHLTTGPFLILWDQNGGEGRGAHEVTPELGAGLRTVTVTLDRARLAGQGTAHTDLAVGIRRGQLSLCDVAIRRRGTTRRPVAFGRLRLEVRDGRAPRAVPARIGLFDATGRAPLPSEQALLVHRFTDEVRLLWVTPRDFWASSNRQAFYIGGRYEARIPVGRYELIATRGHEYRAFRGTVDVRENELSEMIVTLERFADLPARGWYSGDAHIHVRREHAQESNAWQQVAAEDVHLGNLLQMGNIAATHFDQPQWGGNGRHEQDRYILASGQEDPRTGHRGHTIHHNLERPIHPHPSEYFLYHRVFEESHRQGGLSGYSHLAPWFNPARGLALDVPFGIVDFVEVLQMGRLNTDIWYSFLNLGYKLLPVAGSDFPYIDLPGAVRSYVKVIGRFTADAWFAGFRSGRTYVTNGPFLEFTVNGRPMGDELRVERGARLQIVAEAELNPDVDRLASLDLLVYGEPVLSELANGRDRVQLRAQVTADRSMWIAARALGQRQERTNTIAAHSNPIYVIVGDEPSWKRDAVPRLVERQRKELQDLMTQPMDPLEDLEPWETRTLLLEQWERQRSLLQSRVDEADARYRALLERAQLTSQP